MKYGSVQLAKDMKALFKGSIPSHAAAREIAEGVVLLVRRALLRGDKVVLEGIGNLELRPGKPYATRTPQGEPWEGETKPRLRALIYEDLRIECERPAVRDRLLAAKRVEAKQKAKGSPAKAGGSSSKKPKKSA